MYPVLDFIPPQVFALFSDVHRMRSQPRPIVAWRAVESEPNAVPMLMILGITFLTLLLFHRGQDATALVPSKARFWQKRASSADQRPSHLLRAQDKYRQALEKLTKVVQKCRALQAQLKVRPGLHEF